jgi:Na+/H+-dicarboxylate symporter
VIVGLFFGEYASVLKVVADGFVKLLQMTVLPYITLSIVTSLGTLSLLQVKTLGFRAGAVLLALWCLGLVFMFLIPLAFPRVETASFFSTTLVEQRRPFNFVDLFIPSNLFHSLANNIVPAVVLFYILLGAALIGVERKQVLLDVFGVAKEALSRATKFVVGLTPYGIFAIAFNRTPPISPLSCRCRGTARVQYLTLLVLGWDPVFHTARPGVFRWKRVGFRLRQVRIGLSKLT